MKFCFLWIAVLLCGCAGFHDEICPDISYTPPEKLVASWPSPFPPLTSYELKQPWAQELHMGKQFGRELDLYRAISCFKRAGYLNPPYHRVQEIDFCLLFAYYLGEKYQEAVTIFEEGSISCVDPSFPAYDTMVTTLWECYEKIGQPEKAEGIIPLMPEERKEKILEGKDLQAVLPTPFLDCYCPLSKSPSTARTLQALFPGAGYYYMGQTSSAITSAVLNALFIWGTVELFQHGHTAWALFTLSLETGWYIGGINGAGLLARQHNETAYRVCGKEYMLQEKLFPILQIQYGF